MKFLQNLKHYWYFCISILILILLIPLFVDNPLKASVILMVLFIWNILGILLKDFVKSSIILLLLTLPFNLTYQLPYSIQNFQLTNPFVNGVIVNYLIPTISIVDLSVLFLLLSFLLNKKISLEWKGFSFLKIFTIFGGYLILQSILKGNFLSVFNSFRILLYVFTFFNVLKHKKEIFDQQFLKYLLFGSILLVLFQGVVALLQFSGGTSLGLSFLGESHVVSGMNGSSFLELKDALYLRGYGTFPHPNLLGGWLIFNIVFGWYLFDNMQRKRDYSIILMLISSIVLVLTFSRISYLVCGIIWGSFLIKVLVKNNRNKNFVFLPLVTERIANLFTGGDTSWSDRLALIQSSIDIIKKNMLSGVGLGEFVSNMGDMVPRTSSGILLLQPVHNLFLLILSEIGLIGSVLFTALLYFFFKNRKWDLRLIVSLIVIFIIGMFDHYLFNLPQGLVLFFMIMVL